MPTASIDRVEDIWYRALDLEMLTIAIGDGGNELGMGKVHEEIITTIPEGDLIGNNSLLVTDKLIIIFQRRQHRACIF